MKSWRRLPNWSRWRIRNSSTGTGAETSWLTALVTATAGWRARVYPENGGNGTPDDYAGRDMRKIAPQPASLWISIVP